MKKIHILLSVCLLLTATEVRAQELELGVKGGMIFSNLMNSGNDTPYSKGYAGRQSWGTGIFGEYRFDDRFSLTVGLDYSRQGAHKYGMQGYPARNVTISKLGPGYINAIRDLFPKDHVYLRFDNEITFDYLMLPVQGRIGWDLSPTSPWRVYAGAGLFASYTVNAERVMSGSDHVYADPNGLTLKEYVTPKIDQYPGLNEDEKKTILYLFEMLDGQTLTMDRDQDVVEGLRPFNFGVIGHVGISYRLGERHKVFAEAGGSYGFRKLQKEAVSGQNRIGAASVMFGYSYALGR